MNVLEMIATVYQLACTATNGYTKSWASDAVNWERNCVTKRKGSWSMRSVGVAGRGRCGSKESYFAWKSLSAQSAFANHGWN